MINKDKWNLNTKLYHNKYQLNKMKKVELLEYNEENPKHYRLSDMTEDDDDYNEVLGWYKDYVPFLVTPSPQPGLGAYKGSHWDPAAKIATGQAAGDSNPK